VAPRQKENPVEHVSGLFEGLCGNICCCFIMKLEERASDWQNQRAIGALV